MSLTALSPRRLFERLLASNKAIVFAILFAVFLSFATPYFLTASNLLGLMRQIVALTVIALAYTFLLAAGEIDLSVGGMVGLIGIVMGKLMVDAGWPWYLAVLAGLVLGALLGAMNAAFVSIFGLPPFIVTLASGAVFTGLIYILSNLIPVSGLPAAFVQISQGRVGLVPYVVIITLVLWVVFYVVARSTVFGQHVIALGGNPEAVRVAGISIPTVRLKVYVLTGLCCGLSSVFLTSRAASAQIAAGSDLLLLVIAAVVIGGTPLLGGKADVIGTMFGCLIIGMISNGMNLIGVGPNVQVLMQGVLILLALMVDVQSTRLLVSMARRQLDRAQAVAR